MCTEARRQHLQSVSACFFLTWCLSEPGVQQAGQQAPGKPAFSASSNLGLCAHPWAWLFRWVLGTPVDVLSLLSRHFTYSGISPSPRWFLYFTKIQENSIFSRILSYLQTSKLDVERRTINQNQLTKYHCLFENNVEHILIHIYSLLI